MKKFLIESAFNVLKNGLKVKKEEDVLIVADDEQNSNLVEVFMIAGSLLGAKMGQIIYPTVPKQNQEPSAFVAAALKH